MARIELDEDEKPLIDAEIEALVDSITDYIAHRLIERDKALAIDHASGGPVATLRRTAANARSRNYFANELSARPTFKAYLFFVEVFGATVFFALLAAIAVCRYRAAQGAWPTNCMSNTLRD
mgnify:CR=1 FL=1